MAFSAAALLAIGCTRNGFTAQEKRTIGKPGGGIMRLWLVDNPQDSLLLRQTAKTVMRRQAASGTMSVLQERMLATVNDPENPGVGIAAPQVGIPYRMVAVQRFDKEGQPFGFYINPEIISYSEETVNSPEGCLSVPGKNGTVKRSASIEISYMDKDFNPVTERVEGFTAIVFQHEIDHLNGILYPDRAFEMQAE